GYQEPPAGFAGCRVEIAPRCRNVPAWAGWRLGPTSHWKRQFVSPGLTEKQAPCLSPLALGLANRRGDKPASPSQDLTGFAAEPDPPVLGRAAAHTGH